MRVTVAICTYSRAALLRQTLAGLSRQDFPPEEFEVLVIDNNSRDNTRAVVAEFASGRPAPRHILETRQGHSHARNRAIAEARGEVILFGDDDILMEPDWIERAIEPIEADRSRRIAAVGGEVIPSFPDGLPDWLQNAHRPLAYRTDAGPLPADQFPMGANVAFPRWVFAEHGLFETDLGRLGGRLTGGDDGEMARRLRRAGLEIWFAPAARVLHQFPASRLTFRYARRHAFDSARSRVIEKVNLARASGRSPAGYLASRAAANLAKLPGFLVLALAGSLAPPIGRPKMALVRAWRCCGYLYQITRSCLGKS